MPADTARILIADDQPEVLHALRLLLKDEDFAVETAASPAGVLEAMKRDDFDAVLIDLNYARDTTSGREGLDLLAVLHAGDATLPVVVMTAWGSIEGAVEAMRRGAARGITSRSRGTTRGCWRRCAHRSNSGVPCATRNVWRGRCNGRGPGCLS